MPPSYIGQNWPACLCRHTPLIIILIIIHPTDLKLALDPYNFFVVVAWVMQQGAVCKLSLMFISDLCGLMEAHGITAVNTFELYLHSQTIDLNLFFWKIPG